MTTDLSTLSTAELCERARILADEFRSIGKGTEFATATDGTADHLIELSRRLDALRWREAGEVPEKDLVGVAMACVVRALDEVMVDTGWFDGDEWRIAGPMPFELIAWMPLPAYEPEREVRDT